MVQCGESLGLESYLMQTGLKVFQDPLKQFTKFDKNLNGASQRIWNHLKYGKLLEIQSISAT